jgi:hypothetical protein
MNKVKKRKQNFLSVQYRKEMREKLATISLTKLEDEDYISRRTIFHRDQWGELVREFSDFVLQKAYTTLLSACDILKTEQNLQKLLGQLPSKLSSKPLNVLLSQAKDFLNWIRYYKQRDIMLTDQMNIDVNTERRHILLLEASLETQLMLITCKTKIDDDDKQLLTETSLYETNGEKIPKLTEDSEYSRMLKRLQSMLAKYRVPLTIEEGKMIIKAVGAKPGSWYKCDW